MQRPSASGVRLDSSNRQRWLLANGLLLLLLTCRLLCLQTAGLSSFVRQHVVLRTDTLQMLAVRHGIDVPGLKRVNNLMTDHSLHSRTHLFIPGGPGWLACAWRSRSMHRIVRGVHMAFPCCHT
jgi:hypothetical protein